MEQARADQVVQEAAEAQEMEVIEEEVLVALGLFQGTEEGPDEVFQNLMEPHHSLRRQDSNRRSP